MPAGHIRVFLCDDVAEFRLLMRFALEEDPAIRIVGEADNGRTGVELIAEIKPDVVLLDLSMPELDGLEAIPLIREHSPDTRIVVLSGFGADGAGAALVLAQHCRYIEKGAPLDDIRAAVRESEARAA